MAHGVLVIPLFLHGARANDRIRLVQPFFTGEEGVRRMRKPSFIREFLSHAGQVGSIIPSSPFLTRKMLPITIPWYKMRQIAELGPGTGVFTQSIQQQMPAHSQLYLFEANGNFREMLARRFPSCYLLEDALQLGEAVNTSGRPFDLIVSGLPFANFTETIRNRIFDAIHESLTPNGIFVAFQYTLLLRPQFQTHFSMIDIGYTLLNVPPAWVFKCKKRCV